MWGILIQEQFTSYWSEKDTYFNHLSKIIAIILYVDFFRSATFGGEMTVLW